MGRYKFWFDASLNKFCFGFETDFDSITVWFGAFEFIYCWKEEAVGTYLFWRDKQ